MTTLCKRRSPASPLDADTEGNLRGRRLTTLPIVLSKPGDALQEASKWCWTRQPSGAAGLGGRACSSCGRASPPQPVTAASESLAESQAAGVEAAAAAQGAVRLGRTVCPLVSGSTRMTTDDPIPIPRQARVRANRSQSLSLHGTAIVDVRCGCRHRVLHERSPIPVERSASAEGCSPRRRLINYSVRLRLATRRTSDRC